MLGVCLQAIADVKHMLGMTGGLAARKRGRRQGLGPLDEEIMVVEVKHS
jgi:hypothetical protein